jgi:hypothetical protein
MNEKIKPFPRTSPEATNARLLRSGEAIPESGIYEALHHGNHAEEHTVWVVAIRGERVQPCAGCGEEVSLKLVRAAPHISEDADFCHPRN